MPDREKLREQIAAIEVTLPNNTTRGDDAER